MKDENMVIGKEMKIESESNNFDSLLLVVCE
jgi:hypothetical protein